MSVVQALHAIGGVQAQLPNPAYYGMWSRLRGFTPGDLSTLVEQREVVRISLLRGTIHLVTAQDCLEWTPLLRPSHARSFDATWGKRLDGADVQEITLMARQLVEAAPMTYKDLGERLAERWPQADPQALANTARTYLPLVQVPPRGLWGVPGQAAHTTAEHWLGRELPADSTLDAMVRRYFAAYGPATVQDAQTWCGLTRLREVVERLDLIEVADGLYDVADGPRPDPDVPAPVRFLGEWDNMLLSYVDRERIVDPAFKKRIYTVNGVMPAPFLVDGFVAGVWKLARKKRSATLTLEPFLKLRKADVAELEQEGMRLLEFAAPDAVEKEVRCPATPPS